MECVWSAGSDGVDTHRNMKIPEHFLREIQNYRQLLGGMSVRIGAN